MANAKAAKLARRRKRRAQRAARLANLETTDFDHPDSNVPRDVSDAILGVGASLDDYSDDVVNLVQQAMDFDRRLTTRGWTFDAEHGRRGLASWWYALSAIEPDDDAVEAVTRIWFTATDEDDPGDAENFPHSVHLILAGSTDADEDLRLTPDQLLDQIESIESYRAR